MPQNEPMPSPNVTKNVKVSVTSTGGATGTSSRNNNSRRLRIRPPKQQQPSERDDDEQTPPQTSTNQCDTGGGGVFSALFPNQLVGTFFLSNSSGSGSMNNGTTKRRNKAAFMTSSTSTSTSDDRRQGNSSHRRRSKQESTNNNTATKTSTAEEVMLQVQSLLNCTGPIGLSAAGGSGIGGGVPGIPRGRAFVCTTDDPDDDYDDEENEYDDYDDDEVNHDDDVHDELQQVDEDASVEVVRNAKDKESTDAASNLPLTATNSAAALLQNQPKSTTSKKTKDESSSKNLAGGDGMVGSSSTTNKTPSSRKGRKNDAANYQCDDILGIGGAAAANVDDDDIREHPPQSRRATAAINNTGPLSSCLPSVKKSTKNQASSFFGASTARATPSQRANGNSGPPTDIIDAAGIFAPLQRICITGRHGAPLHGSCALSKGQMLLPSGRWKFSFATPSCLQNNATAAPNSPTSPTTHSDEVRIVPSQMLKCEVWIGSIALPLFPKHSTVTLFQYDSTVNHCLTVTIAPPAAPDSSSPKRSGGKSPTSTATSVAAAQQQLSAVIAVLHPVSKRFCQAAKLVKPGDVALLKVVCQLLDEWAPTACFTLWSLGIPSTVLSQTLVANLVQLHTESGTTSATVSAIIPQQPSTSKNEGGTAVVE